MYPDDIEFLGKMMLYENAKVKFLKGALGMYFRGAVLELHV